MNMQTPLPQTDCPRLILCPYKGSLLNLAKHPASTVQILGAEKALFRALKTRRDTPKYGLIYHASLVGQTTAKNKGKVSGGGVINPDGSYVLDGHMVTVYRTLLHNLMQIYFSPF